MRERKNDNFNFHTGRKMAGEDRQQFQVSHTKKNGRRGKTAISIFIHEEKWWKRNRTLLTVTCQEKKTLERKKTTISIFTRGGN